MTETFDKKPLLAKIHIAKKELGLDDDMYRDLLFNITGERSAAKLTFNQLEAVLKELQGLGFRPTKKKSDKPYIRLIYALWRELTDLKVVSNKNGLNTFCLNQTGINSPEWLDVKQANKVIEGLKAWIKRVKSKKDNQ